MQIKLIENWGVDKGVPIKPREWQARALKTLVEHYQKQNPPRAVCHAVTGSGKAALISALCGCIQCGSGEVVVVSTSRQKLVRQLRKSIENRMESGDEFMSKKVVGSFFADSRDGLDDRTVIICCNDSMKNLADALYKQGKKCAMLLIDELHRSENRTMKEAYDAMMPQYTCGFSATPFLSSEKRGISNLDCVVVKYDMKQALEDKVIVPWKVVGWEGGEIDLDSACLQMLKEYGGRAIVNAVSIADAEQFSKFCSENDYSMKAVHSRQSDKEVDEIINEMVVGKIQAICHIDLLTEGVDIREAKVLCLRRVVGSRNRFIQELGRGIRSYTDPVTGEEKTHLTVLDPHDLISIFSLSPAAVLSGDFDPDSEDDPEGGERSEGKKLERILQNQVFEVVKMLSQAKAGKEPFSNAPLASYLSQLCSVFDTFGLMDKPLSSREWRREPASEKQVRSMQNMKWTFGRKQVPSIHRTALEMIAGEGSKFTRGVASDLISVQLSLAEHSSWPKFSQLDLCAKDSLDRHAKRKAGPVKAKPVQTSSFITKPAVKMEQGTLFEISSPKGKQK